MAHPTRIFNTPDELEKAWNEYKDDLKERSKEWPIVQYVGRNGDKKIHYPKLPKTKDDFEVWCKNKYGCVEQYFKNQDGYYDDFIPLCSHIRKECRADQITGGLLGQYNASITQRLNGLADKTETKDTTEPRVFKID
jgi:hypothetical protein